jgi:hypothetical protein
MLIALACALASPRVAAADTLRVLVRVASPADRALVARVRGQLSDVSAELTPVETAPLEATFAEQVQAAHALAGQRGADVVLWFASTSSAGAGSASGLLVHVATPRNERILTRRLLDGDAADGGKVPSSLLETAALTVRSAITALAAGGGIGVTTAEALAAQQAPPTAAEREAAPRSVAGPPASSLAIDHSAAAAPARDTAMSTPRERTISDVPTQAAGDDATANRRPDTSPEVVSQTALHDATTLEDPDASHDVLTQAALHDTITHQRRSSHAPTQAVRDDATARERASSEAAALALRDPSRGSDAASSLPALGASELPAPRSEPSADDTRRPERAPPSAAGLIDTSTAPDAQLGPRAPAALSARLQLGVQCVVDGQSELGQRGLYARAGVVWRAFALDAYAVASLASTIADDYFALRVARHALGGALSAHAALARDAQLAFGVHGGALLLARTSGAKAGGVSTAPSQLMAAFAFGPELALDWLFGRYGLGVQLALDVLPSAPRFEARGASPLGAADAHRLWLLEPRLGVGLQAAVP